MSIGAWIWAAEAAVSGTSVLVGRPWTTLLSAPRFDAQVRDHPLFREANMVISVAWTLYFVLAALVSAVTNPWVSLALIVPTPFLGWLSFEFGDRYPRWRMQRVSGTVTNGGASMSMPPHEMSTPPQEWLRAMISDKSDEEILALLDEVGGPEGVLDATMVGMADALDPDTAVDCVVGYEIDAQSQTFAYRVLVQGNHVESERRPPSDARVVLQLSVPEYLRLITGLLDGREAFMNGRMRIRGDVMFAPQIGRMFRTA